MKFAPVPLSEAKGKVLGHNIARTNGQRLLRKGKPLTEEDLEKLRALGRSSVYVAEMEPDAQGDAVGGEERVGPHGLMHLPCGEDRRRVPPASARTGGARAAAVPSPSRAASPDSAQTLYTPDAYAVRCRRSPAPPRTTRLRRCPACRV